MSYEYKFDEEECWYKNTCPYYKDKSICNPSCIRYMEMHFLMNNSGIPKARQHPTILTPGAEDRASFLRLKNIKDNIVEFVDSGESIYIFSEGFGNGKTTWSIKLMQQYFDKVWNGNGFIPRGIFVNVPTFLTKIKEGISKKDTDFELLKSRIPKVDLVVWDDIAATKLSDYDHTMLLTYIDQRKLNGYSNIYTGNIKPDQLLSALGNRLTSRVYNDSVTVEFKGVDRRGSKW